MEKQYALYKGEECLAIGTIKEIAEQLKVQVRTIYFYTTKAYKKRCKNGINRRVIVEV